MSTLDRLIAQVNAQEAARQAWKADPTPANMEAWGKTLGELNKVKKEKA